MRYNSSSPLPRMPSFLFLSILSWQKKSIVGSLWLRTKDQIGYGETLLYLEGFSGFQWAFLTQQLMQMWPKICDFLSFLLFFKANSEFTVFTGLINIFYWQVAFFKIIIFLLHLVKFFTFLKHSAIFFVHILLTCFIIQSSVEGNYLYLFFPTLCHVLPLKCDLNTHDTYVLWIDFE